jgi:hypothetical protein
VDDHVGDTKLGGTIQLNHHSINRLFPELVDRTGQVDQVGGVREAVFDVERAAGLLEQLNIILADWLCPPLVIILGEQLNTVTTVLTGGFHGTVIPTRHRHVGTKDGEQLRSHDVDGCGARLVHAR